MWKWEQWKKMGQSVYFKKLVLLIVLLGALPTLILGVYSYDQASRSVRQHAVEGSKQFLAQSQLRVEQNLKNIDTTLTSFLHSSFVQTVLKYPLSPAYYDAFDQLEKTMYRLQIFELQVDEITLYNMREQWTISNGGIKPLEDRGHLRELSRSMNDISGNSQWLLRPEGGFSLLKKDPLYMNQPNTLLEAYISDNAIRRVLDTNEETGNVFIATKTGQPIAFEEGNGLLTEEQFRSVIKHSRDERNETGSFTYHAEDGKLDVMYRESSYNGWVYYSIIPISKLTSDLKSIGSFTILICGAILLVLAILALVGSNSMYRPIRKLYQSLSGSDDTSSELESLAKIDTDTGDELQYIRARVLKMLKEGKQLSSQNQIQIEHLKQFFVQRLIQGTISEREIREKMSMFQLPDRWDSICVIVVQIDKLTDTRYQEEDRDLLLFAIGNIVSEVVPQGQSLSSIVADEGQITIYGSRAEDAVEFKRELYNLTERIQTAVSDYLELSVSIGVSRTFSNLKQSARAYKQGLDALQYRLRLGSRAILFLEEVEPKQADIWSYPVHLEEELTEAVRLYDYEHAQALLRKFILSVFEQNENPKDYQLALTRLLVELIRQLQDAGISHHALYTEDMFLLERLLQFRTAEEVEQWFELNIVAPIVSMLREKRSGHQQEIAEHIYRMIQAEFETELTLELCANRLNYHPDYVGRLFREQYGVSFTEFLMQQRLKAAKQWLCETDWKISEIAAKLQYSSPANFIRSFRKWEGMTPGQYREQSFDLRKANAGE